MNCIQYKKGQEGFTLVEMIIYIGILSVIAIFVVDALLLSVNAFTQIRLTRDINQSATTALERMVRDIRTATSVDVAASTFNTNSSDLILNTTDASSNPTTEEFFISGNAIHVKVGGVDQGTLVASDITVPKLVFSHVSTANSEAIRIQLELSGTKLHQTQTAMFYDTVVLRGAY